MKNVVSAYIVRWNFMLGAIFVAIVIFMPEGLVPGTVRWLVGRARDCQGRFRASPLIRSPADELRLAFADLEKSFGGLRVTRDVNLEVDAGRAAADHRSERRRQDDAVQPDHR